MRKLAAWRQKFKRRRIYRYIGYLMPLEFAARHHHVSSDKTIDPVLPQQETLPGAVWFFQQINPGTVAKHREHAEHLETPGEE